MYKQRRSGPPLLLLIIIGAIAGLVFFVVNNLTTNPGDSTNETDVISGNPTPIVQPSITLAPPVDNEVAAVVDTDVVANNTDSLAVADTIVDTQAESFAANPGENAYDIPANETDIGGKATIFIPSAGIYSDIVRVYLDGTSWDVSQLGKNIGHLQGTPWVGEPGNIVLSGHVELSDGSVGVFANLEEIHVNDFIIIQQDNQEWRYQVQSVGITEPTDLTPLFQTPENQLTLITCDRYDFFQDAYLDRTIIIATQVS